MYVLRCKPVGGGSTIGAPVLDDDADALQAQNPRLCVASIGDQLGPAARFPTAPIELARPIEAVIQDAELPGVLARRSPALERAHVPAGCDEAEAVAEKLAEGELGGKTLLRADGGAWREGRARWETVLGNGHGFDRIPERSREVSKARRARALQMCADAIAWLEKEFYA